MCGGPIALEWKKKPVTLVSTVAARNSIVTPFRRRLPSMANSTTRPATMPTRLMMTWSVVNAPTDRPRIMRLPKISPPAKEATPDASTQRERPNDFVRRGRLT